MSIRVRSLKTCIARARFHGYLCGQCVSSSRFSFLGFSNAPTPSLRTLVDHRALRVLRGFTIGNPLGCRGSACVEVMTTLHGSALSLRRRAEGCIPPERVSPYAWVHLRAFRASIVTFTAAMASIQEALASLRQEIVPQASPYVLHGHSEVAPPTTVQTTVTDDTHARMDRTEQRMRQMRVELTLEGAAWLMDLDGNRFSKPTNLDQLKRYYV
ncbi:hypothetical protein AAG906_006993 [Vitis piasezkii]